MAKRKQSDLTVAATDAAIAAVAVVAVICIIIAMGWER